jgi:4-amino-4-deoxy-L-arabinose transferase-like glycosyltransferase
MIQSLKNTKKMGLINNRNAQLTFVGVLLFILFLGNSTLSLWDDAEAQTALLAQEIAQTGSFQVLFFNVSDGFFRPPLHLFTTVLSYKAFGISEFSTRFPSVVYVILTFLALLFFVKKIYNEQVAILSAVVLASTFGGVSVGKMHLAESGLMFYETVLLFAFWLQLKSPNWRYLAAFWGALLLALLQGGFEAAILAVGIWGVLFFTKKELRPALWKLQPWFLLLVALPLLGWAMWATSVETSAEVRTFWGAFLEHKAQLHIGRQTLWLLVFFLPWLAFLPVSIWRLASDWRTKKDADAIFWTAAVLFGGLLFEFVPTTLSLPSVAIYPVLALLIAQEFLKYDAACQLFHELPINQTPEIRAKAANFFKENVLKTVQLLGIIGVFCVMFVLSMISYGQGLGILRTSFVGMILWITSFAAAIGLYSRSSKLVLNNAVLGGVLFMFFGWLLVAPVLDYARSVTRRTVETVANTASDETLIWLDDDFTLPSLPFYLNQKQINFAFAKSEKQLLEQHQSNENKTLLLDERTYRGLREGTDSTYWAAQPFEKVEGVLFDKFKSGDFFVVPPRSKDRTE